MINAARLHRLLGAASGAAGRARTITTRAAAEAAQKVYLPQREAHRLQIANHVLLMTSVRKAASASAEPRHDMAAWLNPEKKELIVAIRGSAEKDDWLLNNLPIALNQTPARYSEALDFVQQAIAKAGEGFELKLVGHSLGGGLAQILSAKLGVTAVTFNAPPMRSLIDGRIRFDIGLTEEQIDAARASEQCVNYRTSMDPVSVLPGLHVGDVQEVFSPEMNPVSAHGMQATVAAVEQSEHRDVDH